MKASNVFLVILILISSCSPQKRMIKDTWIRVHTEKKDGSRYVDRNPYGLYNSTVTLRHGNMDIVHDDLGVYGISSKEIK